jgi:hypothetical protein
LIIKPNLKKMFQQMIFSDFHNEHQQLLKKIHDIIQKKLSEIDFDSFKF